MTTTEKSLGTLRLQTQIGFTNIADIIRSRSIDLGFELNVLVVGRRGLGTSTMVNSLFGAPIISKTRSNEITVTKNEIIENGISLETTIITFHESDIDPVLEYVDLQYYDYYENEQSIFGTYRGGGRNLSGGEGNLSGGANMNGNSRSEGKYNESGNMNGNSRRDGSGNKNNSKYNDSINNNTTNTLNNNNKTNNNTTNTHNNNNTNNTKLPTKDNRIHACLYLIPSDNLHSIEIENIKTLSKKLNLIPVIPKADMYTKEELQLRKKQISDLLKTNNITFFIPETESSQDSEEDSSEDEFPLAVIASETMHEREGEIVRGRSYPWGFINIENENGNDFKKLQRMLIYKHYDELINKTHFVFYNEYRKNVIENEKMSESLQLTRYNKLMRDIHNKIKDKMRCKISELEDEEREIDMCIGRKEDKMKGD